MSQKSLGERLLDTWNKCQKLPFGGVIFSRYLGFMIPYTGSIKATVVHLEKSIAKVQLKPRRRVFNHLHSVHAIALANLGEFTTGLALITAAPDNAKSILVGFQVRYLKKARGMLYAQAQVTLPDFDYELEQLVNANIVDSEDEVVAEITATWKLRKDENAPV